MLPPLSLYIHIPWCLQKCPYCDFNSHAVNEPLAEKAYIQVLLADLAFDIERFAIDRPIQTIFIGGGTPSLFSAESIYLLLEGVSKLITLQEKAEITLEANPGTFESEKFKGYYDAGVNRLSIGIQSFNKEHLKKLGRVHTATDALNAGKIARSSGFELFNVDLMFGLPQQTIEQALANVNQAIELKPTHVSLYQLTLEPNTYFHKFPPSLPEDEALFEMQQQCQALLEKAQYQQYEISAYAQKNKRCEHNLNYWKFGDYLGIGAGAHGKISQELPHKIYRTSKIKSPNSYLKNIRNRSTIISQKDIPLEFMMNQLRLKQGFFLDDYQSMTGLPIKTLEPALTKAIHERLLKKQGTHYSTTPLGWNFLDTLLEKWSF
jgi:oxygen-independent coproporphyrinogen-3 oxidase